MLKIPPQHNGVMPIKIGGPIIEEQMAYFITDNNTSKGRDPNIKIIISIHRIKGKTFVNILISNYTNKHLTFHKWESVGHLEPAVIDDTTIDVRETHQTNSIMLQKWWQRKLYPISSIHHAIHYLTIYRMTLMHYWRNMSLSLWKMNHQLELHPSPAWQLTQVVLTLSLRSLTPLLWNITNGWSRKQKSYLQPRSSVAADQICQCQL